MAASLTNCMKDYQLGTVPAEYRPLWRVASQIVVEYNLANECEKIVVKIMNGNVRVVCGVICLVAATLRI